MPNEGEKTARATRLRKSKRCRRLRASHLRGERAACLSPGVPGHEPDIVRAQYDADAVTAAMRELRKLEPRAASYVWETDYFESNWQDSFWGNNYAQLRAIKQQYDPDGLFFLHHGVGSENWSADGFSRVEAR